MINEDNRDNQSVRKRDIFKIEKETKLIRRIKLIFTQLKDEKMNKKKRRPHAVIYSSYRRILGKLASLVKILLSQDQSCISLIFSILLELNPNIVKLILKKSNYFFSLVCNHISLREIRDFEFDL